MLRSRNGKENSSSQKREEHIGPEVLGEISGEQPVQTWEIPECMPNPEIGGRY